MAGAFINRDYADKKFLGFGSGAAAHEMQAISPAMLVANLGFATLAVIGLLTLTGCSTVPPTNVHQPMSVRPAPIPDRIATGGAIFQANYSRPLFEDRRARNVGDVITINISETTSASKNVSSTADKSSSISQTAVTPTILGYKPDPSKLWLGGIIGSTTSVDPVTGVATVNPPSFDTSITASGAQSFSGKGDSAQKNALIGTITVTVIEVLPNGNLLVSGEKQMGMNEGTEYIRFSGVVNPSTISSTNTVSSTQVADARIEFKGRGEIDSAQAMGWLTKFFLSVLPF
ncbi:MAG TPA: flagellar basal body L-ring protein FlgH [Sulfuricella sp.]|nr:flagellar basal body L-ring protein FlgH [Sulfuricella sp.]